MGLVLATDRRTFLSTTQRARPAIICDNASFPLPWKRNDASEFFSGDNSQLHSEYGNWGGIFVSTNLDEPHISVSTGFRGWRTARLSAPVAAVLFRSSSWTDIRVRALRLMLCVFWACLTGFFPQCITQWSNSKQSILALVGSSLGYAGVLFTAFRIVKQYFHHHAAKVWSSRVFRYGT